MVRSWTAAKPRCLSLAWFRRIIGRRPLRFLMRSLQSQRIVMVVVVVVVVEVLLLKQTCHRAQTLL